MPIGGALVVGLKSVDPARYGGWTGVDGCWGCELDADNVSRLLSAQGFEVSILKTRKATGDAVLGGLRSLAGRLGPEDFLAFYFSGHGGQQPDMNNDELDGMDETLVAYDRQIIDDELDPIWKSLAAGLRVVMISDSCNSGTNYKNRGLLANATAFSPMMGLATEKRMSAQMIHMGGCRDGFGSSGYHGGGAFTIALCNVWAGGAFQGNHKRLLDQIRLKVGTEQVPQYNEYGAVTPAFRQQRPFLINV
jgi:hypothetical protein